MKMPVLLIGLFLSSIFLSNAAMASDWLLNNEFTNPAIAFDTGVVKNSNVAASPDSWKWGYSCYKWDSNSASYPIDSCQVKSYSAGTNDYNVILYGYSIGSDKTGVVKLVQGNVWGGSVPWYVPPKLSINTGENIYIDSWYNVDMFYGTTSNFMYDIWLKDDSTGKIMVLDLMFSRRVPWLNSWWDGTVFHYQTDVCGSGGWYHCNINLKYIIGDAINTAKSKGVTFNVPTTYIYQVEILFELQQAVAQLDVGSFRLYHEPPPTRPPGGCQKNCYMLAVGPYLFNVDIEPILSVVSAVLVLIEILVVMTIYDRFKHAKRRR